MTARQDDGTWPLAGWHIWHAPQGLLRRFGYAYEDSVRGVHRALRAARKRHWHVWGLDLDVRTTGPCHHRAECPRGLRGMFDAGIDPPCEGHLVNKHWDENRHRDRATRNGRPVRRRASHMPLKHVLDMRLRGGYRPKTAERMLRLVHRLGGIPAFEVKGYVPTYELKHLHQVAQDLDARLGLMALPENLRFIAQTVRGPLFGMALTRRVLSARQADDLDGAKVGRSSWARPVEAQGKRVLGRGRHWGQSN